MKPLVFRERPPEFWTAMGPLFADAKMRRARPYLHDDERLIWALGLDDERRCAAFCSFEMTDGAGRIREFWQRQKPGEVAADDYGLIAAALAHMRLAGVRSVTGRLEKASSSLLRKNGFTVGKPQGNYVDVELAL